MNIIMLVGRLGKDPELRFTQGGKAVCAMSLAVNREFAKDGDEKADWFDVTAWGAVAENCAKYLAKGREVAVQGRVQFDRWEDENGNKRRSTKVIASNVQFLGGGGSNAGSGSGQKTGSTGFDAVGTEVFFDDSDLPF